MQKWNIPTARAERVDERDWFIFLFILFTPKVTVIKMSKMAHFILSFADDSKQLVKVWTKYSSVSERPYLALSKNAMD